MSHPQLVILPPEEIERRRALEFLALSPTEKYEALIDLITITNEVRQAGEFIYQKKK